MEPTYLEVNSGLDLRSKIYIEGPGTTDLKTDDEKGKGLGEGPTGIEAKVEKACVKTMKKIENLLNLANGKKIKMLQIDVFGFSRGAACVRNYIHEITKIIRNSGRPRTIITRYGKLGEKLIEQNIEQPQLLKIRYAGLFETVASFGLMHMRDTSQLNLDAVRRAHHTFHLVAQDEHRENFVLTNINSAKGKGTEKFIPGVHSDIGGGYINNYDEDYLVIMEGQGSPMLHNNSSKLLRERLIADSWYRPKEIYVNKHTLKKPENQHIHSYNAVLVKKAVVSNRYSYISLHLMVEYSVEKDIPFNYDMIKENYDLEEKIHVNLPDGSNYTTSLREIKRRLHKHIFDGAEPMRFDDPDDEKMIRAIRANCMHTSAHYSGKVWAKVLWYAPHKPHVSYYNRSREENNG